MKKNNKSTFPQCMRVVVLLLAPALAWCQAPSSASANHSQGPAATVDQKTALPPILQNVGINQHLGSAIPLDDTFTDESGRTVPLQTFFHSKKPVVLILAYYHCPMLCSEVLSGATSAFKKTGFAIGKQFNVLTVSFDPQDTPQIAAQTKQTYMQQYGDPNAAEGWHFLVGTKPHIDALANAVGFHYAFDPKTGLYAHAAGLVVITPAGKLAQYFYGVEFPEHDLRLALVQSSADKIGTLADEILLYCCKYDPNTGRYQAVIARVLQIAGAFTILVIGGGLLWFFRLDAKIKAQHG